MSRSGSLASDWYHLGRVRSLDEISAALDALTAAEVGAFAAALPLDEMTILTLGPEPLTASADRSHDRSNPFARILSDARSPPVTFHHATLPNGLQVILELNERARSVAAGFFVRTGSRDETAGAGRRLALPRAHGLQGDRPSRRPGRQPRLRPHRRQAQRADLRGGHDLPRHLPARVPRPTRSTCSPTSSGRGSMRRTSRPRRRSSSKRSACTTTTR